MKPSYRLSFLFLEAFKEWIRDSGKNIAASLAYYQLLSFAPLIGFCLFLSHKILGVETTNTKVIPILQNYFSPQFVKVITFFLSKDKYSSLDDLYALSILSGIALAYGANEYFGMIKNTIQISWNQRREEFGFIETLKRIKGDLQVAFGSILIIFIFLLLRSLLPHPFITSETSLWYEKNIFLHLTEDVFTLVMISCLQFFYFVSIPPVKVYWKNAIPPALLGALYYVIGREIMRWHMYQNPDANMSESLLLVLVWFYYSNIAFVYASEFARLYISKKQNINYNDLTNIQ
jgi:membrane protein